MIILYLKDRKIELLPLPVVMFYRLAAFTNGAGGAPSRRLVFDTEDRIESFRAAFPEIVPYLERPEVE
jgi:hypothetical protein